MCVLGILALLFATDDGHARGFGTPTVDGVKDAIYGTAEAVDMSGPPQGNAVMDLGSLYVVNDANFWYFYFTVNANVVTTNWGKYLLYIDTNGTAASGATSDAWGRNVAVLDPHKPEYSLNSWVDGGGGYSAAKTQFFVWGGTSWSQSGGADAAALAVNAGVSGLEWKVARSRIGDPTQIWCEVYSTGGTSNDNAQDTINNPPDDWNATDWSTQAILACSTNVPRTNGADTTPPTVSGALALGVTPMDSIQVQFSEPVDKTTAQTTTNYAVTGGVSVLAATRSNTDSSIVVLRTSTLPVGVSLKVTVTNVKDKAGNTIVANGTTNVACFFLAHLYMRAHMSLHLRTHSQPPNQVGWEGSTAPLTWDPLCDFPLSDADGDSVYTGDAFFTSASNCATGTGSASLEYKLTHLCTEYETINNHVYTLDVNTGTDTLDIWWNDLAPGDYTARAVAVVFSVDLTRQNPTGTDVVTVNGSQNPLTWSVPSITRMKDDGVPPDAVAGDKIYTVKVRFPSATYKTVEYKFLLNDQYECSDGQPNRSFVLDDVGHDTTNAQVLPKAYYNRCSTTGRAVAVTWRVNTQYLQTPHGPSDTLYVNGSVPPLTWNIPPTMSNRLLDNGVAPDLVAGDGIYSGTITFPDSSYKYVTYKFVFKNTYECLSQTDRSLTLDDVNYSSSTPMIVNADWNACQTTAVETPRDLGRRVQLAPVVPTPSNGRVALVATLPAAGWLRLAVTDANGRTVRTLVAGPRPSGSVTAVWDGRDESGRTAPRGVYFATLESSHGTARQRIVLVR
jgi:hypothetical protein